MRLQAARRWHSTARSCCSWDLVEVELDWCSGVRRARCSGRESPRGGAWRAPRVGGGVRRGRGRVWVSAASACGRPPAGRALRARAGGRFPGVERTGEWGRAPRVREGRGGASAAGARGWGGASAADAARSPHRARCGCARGACAPRPPRGGQCSVCAEVFFVWLDSPIPTQAHTRRARGARETAAPRTARAEAHTRRARARARPPRHAPRAQRHTPRRARRARRPLGALGSARGWACGAGREGVRPASGLEVSALQTRRRGPSEPARASVAPVRAQLPVGDGSGQARRRASTSCVVKPARGRCHTSARKRAPGRRSRCRAQGHGHGRGHGRTRARA